MVLGICRFHRNSNGWDDVGYNFFVDKYGRIFEGRAGGMDQPVMGAQAQGWNSHVDGRREPGDLRDVPQTARRSTRSRELLAWKLPLHGAPVTGPVTVSSGGGREPLPARAGRQLRAHLRPPRRQRDGVPGPEALRAAPRGCATWPPGARPR